MKTRHSAETARTACALLLLTAAAAPGQGTFIYDQQSATEATGGGAVARLQDEQPIGQSFTPTNSAVGFIRLWLQDGIVNRLGSTIYVVLRSNSITGPIMSSTDPVFLPDSFGAFGSSPYTNFFFATPVPVMPGTIYYFQPIIQSGDTNAINTIAYTYNYPGGTAFARGVPSPTVDLWFREGTFVPEPFAPLLVLAGIAAYIGGSARRNHAASYESKTTS